MTKRKLFPYPKIHVSQARFFHVASLSAPCLGAMLGRKMNRQTQNLERRGIAVVEFAIILPIFVLILLGTIEACTMVFLQQSLEIAAYESSRVTIVPKTTQSDVQAAANSILDPRNNRRRCSLSRG